MKHIYIIFSLLTLATISCGSDETPKQTLHGELEDIKGETLSKEDVEDLLRASEIYCQLPEPGLQTIWNKLEEEDFPFQDFVFEYTCPEKLEFYKSTTGRLQESE